MSERIKLYNRLYKYICDLHKWENQIEELKSVVSETEKENGDTCPIKARIKVLFQNITYVQKEIEKINRMGARI